MNSPKGPATGVRMQIDANSVTTDDKWQDDYLRGPTFFAVDRYPHITFSGYRVWYWPATTTPST